MFVVKEGIRKTATYAATLEVEINKLRAQVARVQELVYDLRNPEKGEYAGWKRLVADMIEIALLGKSVGG